MRIVVKPAGLLIVIAMIGVLAAIAFMKNRPANTTPAPAMANSATPAARPQPTKSADGNLLSNAGFENGFSPVAGAWSGAKGQASGISGNAWHDDSIWGPVVVEYAEDHEKPHSGASSQRIKMTSTGTDGRCQFVQEAPGKAGVTYRQTLWVRASQKDVPVTLYLRQKDSPFMEYKKVVTKVGTAWKQLTLDGTPSQDGTLFFMVSFNTPGAAIWLDDAAMTAL